MSKMNIQPRTYHASKTVTLSSIQDLCDNTSVYSLGSFACPEDPDPIQWNLYIHSGLRSGKVPFFGVCLFNHYKRSVYIFRLDFSIFFGDDAVPVMTRGDEEMRNARSQLDVFPFPLSELRSKAEEHPDVEWRLGVDVIYAGDFKIAPVTNPMSKYAPIRGLFPGKGPDDVTFCVRGVYFPASKATLSERSPYFRAMFESDVKDSRITIDDVDSFLFKLFLQFIETGKPSASLKDFAFELFALCHRFQVDALKKTCADAIAAEFSVETAIKAAVLADKLSHEALEEAAVRYLNDHIGEVVEHPAWAHVVGYVDGRMNVVTERERKSHWHQNGRRRKPLLDGDGGLDDDFLASSRDS